MKTSLNPAATSGSVAAPRTVWSFLSILVVCALLAFAIYKLAPAKTPAPPHRLWTPLVVNNLGGEMNVPDQLRLEFWTPSSKTKDYVTKNSRDGADTNRHWEILESEEPVVQFGQRLRKDDEVLGFRRTEVWGHGRTGLKPGWWWSITVRTNYPPTKLAKTYREFWKTSNSVFVEVIDNRGHEPE